jgi:hypothetical protein
MPRDPLNPEKRTAAIQSSYTADQYDRIGRQALVEGLKRNGHATLQERAMLLYMEGSLGELPRLGQHSRLPSFLAQPISSIPVRPQVWAGLQVEALRRGIDPRVRLAQHLIRALVGRELRDVPEFQDSGFSAESLVSPFDDGDLR